MNEQPSFPVGSKVLGRIYPPSAGPACLTEDMLQVELPNRLFVDVGWHPEHDLGGRYFVTVFREVWENRLRQEAVSSFPSVVETVEKWCREFSVLPTGLLVDTTPLRGDFGSLEQGKKRTG